MESFVFARSALGLAIPAFHFAGGGSNVLILGGVHGNEIEGTAAAFSLLDHFTKKFDFALNVTLVPTFNLDGVLKMSRLNGRGVDLNRNLPTKDWNPKAFDPKYPPGPHAGSEPENQGLVSFLDKAKPALILSLHSWHPLLNVNGACLPQAEAISKLTSYEVKEEIGYPTPGCLGTYGGLERSMPTLTYEIERGLALEKVIEIHVPAIMAGLRVTEKE